MTNEITNGVLLQHIQGMKYELQQQIAHLDTKMAGRMDGLEQKMDRGFLELRQGQQALEEDLVATMKMVVRHEEKLARL